MNKKRNILFLTLFLFWNFDLCASEFPTAVKNAWPAIWAVESPLSKGTFVGTGFFVSPKLFITNFHVVEEALIENKFESISLRQKQNPENIKKPVRVLAVSINPDLALLKIEKETDLYLDIRTSSLDKEEKLFMVGYPEREFRIMETIGSIRKIPYKLAIHINNHGFKGGSGSPLLDSHANVVGVVFNVAGKEGVFISQNILKEFIEINKDKVCDKVKSNQCLAKLAEIYPQREEDLISCICI